jgi:hypothetical protein
LAIRSRASLSKRRASRPAEWTLLALPPRRAARAIASSTSGAKGVVALLSKLIIAET